MTFPRLKRLTVSLDLEHQEILEAFLINHLTSLVEVDIAVTREFDRIRLEAIKKRCTNLKKFNFEVGKLDGGMFENGLVLQPYPYPVYQFYLEQVNWVHRRANLDLWNPFGQNR